MPPITTHCANCDARVNARVLYGRGSDGAGQPQHTSWAICPVCTAGILVLADGAIYPPVPAGGPVKGLPEDVEAAWGEARRAFGAGAYTAAELLCRKILMHIAVDVAHLEPGLQFVAYIDALEAANYLPAGLKPAVDKIRQRGNFATHQLPASTAPDAHRTMRITHYLLSGTYEIANI